jgi:hypothetical protein
MLAIVISLQTWRHFLEGAEHKTIVYSDHQNLPYVNTALLLIRRQAQWEADLQTFNFDLFDRKVFSNPRTATRSRCLAFNSRAGGRKAAGNQTLLRQAQWLEVGAIQIKDHGIECINIGAMDVEQLFQEPKECIKEKAKWGEDYRKLGKQIGSCGHVNMEYTTYDELLCWKNRVHVAK